LAELAGIWCLALQQASCHVVGSRGVRASNMERNMERQENADKDGSINVFNHLIWWIMIIVCLWNLGDWCCYLWQRRQTQLHRTKTNQSHFLD
jgi:hypothetical protein